MLTESKMEKIKHTSDIVMNLTNYTHNGIEISGYENFSNEIGMESFNMKLARKKRQLGIGTWTKK